MDHRRRVARRAWLRGGRAVSRHCRHQELQNARYSYDSLRQFSVWLPDDKGQETRFVLQRDGVSWRLVNLVLPIDGSF
jgi:hypothetical protein